MFNLENAIQSWKQSLKKSPAFEEGQISEMETHLRDEIDALTATGMPEDEAFNWTAEKFGPVEEIGDEVYKAKTTKPNTTPPWKQSNWMPLMLSNYLKVARRNLVQNKLYAGINIFGLTVAITCCLFIYLFVTNELKTDDFHENGDRIHRVIRIMYDDGVPRKVGITSAPFRDAIMNDFEGLIEEAVRLMPSDGVVTIDYRRFLENRFYITDANFFRVFSWPLLKGDPETALDRPNTVVLSEATAQKYFGSEDPIGKTIQVDEDSEFEITGVFRKPEGSRSHIDFDLLASMETFRNANFYSGWWWNTLHTYVMLSPSGNPGELEARFPDFMEKYFGEDMAQNNRRIDLELQPLEEIYFADDTTFDWHVSHGSKAVIYMFSIVALLIIVVACVNFVNMATARSVNRAREIGIRKTLGAQRFNLMMQFLGEALMMAFAAGVLSFGLVHTLHPWFEQITGTTLAVELFSGHVMGTAFLFLLVTGLLAGAYPALYLSSFEPVKALKEKISFGTSQLIVRKGLIVFQFAISSLLIIGTIIVNKQLNYVAERSLGFQPDQLLNININNGEVRERAETMRDEMERLPGVEAAGVMSGTPGGFFDNYLFRAGDDWEQTYTLKTLFTDHNFSEVLDLEFLVGRDFDPSYGTDFERAVIINKEAADMFGWTPEEALGKRFENQFLDSTAREVIGVVENFHYESLHQSIAPLVVSMNPDQREILVKVKIENLEETLVSIEQVWNEFSPLYPLESFFLDQQFAQLYENDQRQRSVFSAFSLIAIFIACMGLFTLTAFNAEKRRKEMGVRKVLGADLSDILLLFNKEVMTVVFLSFLIAIPAAWFLAEQWLQNYAFRVPNGMINYLLAGVIIMILAVVTVSYQSLKITRMNPVESLKSE